MHELKKELGIESKDIIAVLEQNGITGKKPQSALDAEEEAVVRKAFAKEAKAEEVNPVTVKKEEPKQEAVKKEEKRSEQPKKSAEKQQAAPKKETAEPKKQEGKNNTGSQNAGGGQNQNKNRKNDSKQHNIVTFQADQKSNKKNKKNNKANHNNEAPKPENSAKPEKRSGQFIKPEPKPVEKEPEETIKTVTFPPVMTIKELADKLGTPVNQLIKKLFLAGKMVNVNSDIEYE